jgi:hypothetical protein
LYSALIFEDNATFHANIVAGARSLEVRPHECNPTAVLKKLMNKYGDFEFMLYIGEPTTNQDELEKMPHVYTCSVSAKNQKYYLADHREVLSLMAAMTSNGQLTSTSKKKSFVTF